ncbi:MAG: CADD family putative folate metabolism protein [Chitinophagales bacterium]|nr:CADD family putative folate metabolism protein [Chitinophagales bacterium]
MFSEIKFTEKINSIIESKSLLDHPFYQKWNEGTLSKEMLCEYAKQYYHFVKHFPRFVSAVHSNCDDIGARKILMENLADEEGFKTGTDNHPQLWMNFAASLGLTAEEVKATQPLKETEQLVQQMYELTSSSFYITGLSALYAYEFQVPEISKTKIKGLKDFYGINSEKAIEFFSVHEEADVVHSRDEINIILRETRTEESQNAVLNGAEKSATAMWVFLDGIYNNYCTASA